MAWRLRRVKRSGPFRLTMTKTGLGVSVGGPMGRVSVNTRGQIRETTRVPGVGLYQTKVVGQVGGKRGKRTPPHQSAGTPDVTSDQPVSISALDGTGGAKQLDPASSDVVSLKLVHLVDPVADVANLVGIGKSASGMTNGFHEAILIPEGAEWHGLILVHPEDDPRLKGKTFSAPVIAVHVGRLSVADARKWSPLFKGNPVGVIMFIDATPGIDLVEVRFLASKLADDEPTQDVAPTPVPSADAPLAADPVNQPVAGSEPTVTALPTANWYLDPEDPTKWRWWDGTHWTEHRSPPD